MNKEKMRYILTQVYAGARWAIVLQDFRTATNLAVSCRDIIDSLGMVYRHSEGLVRADSGGFLKLLPHTTGRERVMGCDFHGFWIAEGFTLSNFDLIDELKYRVLRNKGRKFHDPENNV